MPPYPPELMDDDKAVVRTFRARLAAGEEEMLPTSMVERMIGGESAVRVRRERRGVSSAELAKRAGVSSAFVSQIEAGKRPGSPATLRRIADALGIAVDDLV